MQIPNQIADFLPWFKSQTEAFFDKKTKKSEWFYRARWQGLPYSEIEEIEKRYQIQFSPEHRLFLHILHTLDKKKPRQYFLDDGGEETIYESFCHDWRDAEKIAYWLAWPLREISNDIEAGAWLNTWGDDAEDTAAKIQKFQILYQNAPKILPIYGHRFVVDVAGSPVISVWGMDTILYGCSLSDYLMHEFYQFLPASDEFQEQQAQLFPNKIPFWSDLF